ncbi:hypothetical protein K7X08_005739 [Anisodus acutangulus]|uniref:Uncharacterized protein n=1 Tax=Anisodus acutangulus TaxID=402998 RepID=A0A9Q1R7J1_9SOLA|nr:hypothetical protein K7X08_005739 [Anisodus acutangulus]
MAYAAVVSLIQTLKQLMQQKPRWVTNIEVQDEIRESSDDQLMDMNLIFGRHSNLPVEIWKLKLLRHLQRLSDEEIFNQLKFLLIDRTNLKRWEAGSVNFLKLQRLVLKRCIYLEEIPKDFRDIYTLESIELHNCRTSAEKSVKEIQEEQESMANDCLSVCIHEKLWWD